MSDIQDFLPQTRLSSCVPSRYQLLHNTHSFHVKHGHHRCHLPLLYPSYIIKHDQNRSFLPLTMTSHFSRDSFATSVSRPKPVSSLLQITLHNMSYLSPSHSCPPNSHYSKQMQEFFKYEFEVHPCLCKWHNFVPLYGSVIFHYIYVPYLFIHSSIDGLIFKAEIETQTQRMNVRYQEGKEDGTMNWGIGIDTYTLRLLCIKQITNENLLQSARISTQCCVVT